MDNTKTKTIKIIKTKKVFFGSIPFIIQDSDGWILDLGINMRNV